MLIIGCTPTIIESPVDNQNTEAALEEPTSAFSEEESVVSKLEDEISDSFAADGTNNRAGEFFWYYSLQWPEAAYEAIAGWDTFTFDAMRQWTKKQWEYTLSPDFPWADTPNWNAEDWLNAGK